MRIVAGIAILFAVLLVAAFWSERKVPVVTDRVSQPELETVKPGWQGTPVDQDGLFMNDEFPFTTKISGLLKWRIDGNPLEEEKEKDTTRLEVLDPSGFLSGTEDGLIWLGHASFYIRIGGIGILLDPIFGKPPFVKPYVEVPSPLEHLRDVDVVLLSHDHRDHTDEATLRQIAAKFPKAVFYAGLRSEDILNEWKTETNGVKTAGWFQKFGNVHDVEIYFLPARHWSRRGLFDTNKRLWGSYIIRSPRVSIYFSGDSGYGRHYRETGEVFPDIDYFLIGIGAYEPRWFMEPNHNSPAEAVTAFEDAGARTLIPMHFGRFDMSDEPPSWPLRDLKQAAEEKGVWQNVRPLSINEHILFER